MLDVLTIKLCLLSKPGTPCFAKQSLMETLQR